MFKVWFAKNAADMVWSLIVLAVFFAVYGLIYFILWFKGRK